MKTCVKCGVREDEHCTFEADEEELVLPENCVCSHRTWWGCTLVTPICGSYKGTGTNYCGDCEHDKGCHRGIA